jgi:hypothetical protein
VYNGVGAEARATTELLSENNKQAALSASVILLTVVMRDGVPPYRGERLFVGLQHARIYHGKERIETREDLALAESA